MYNREILLKKLRLDSGASDAEIKAAYDKLKNSYELIVISAHDSEIKAIAEKKLKELEGLACFDFNVSPPESVTVCEYEEIVAAAYRVLENSSCGVNELRTMIRKLENLEKTAESFYLQTLMHLEINNGFPGCKNAKQTIENAVALDPQNQAYLALRDGIDSVIAAKNEYDQEQLRIRQEELKQQQEEQKRAATQARWNRVQAICGAIFECTCSIIGGIVECLCSCCSSC